MNYKWTLKDAIFTKDKGKVFSCFACGGGSTMGYKLAGFDVIGCNEIDKRMNDCYIKNHNPKFNYLEDIRVFKERQDLPKELYELDILDGSPPCSSFSMAGNREKDWGKEKKFREGQECQVLDTLFFDFIDLAKKIQPKIVIAENVKGLMLGAAQDYMNKIILAFNDAGYKVNYKLLDASKMGVPQRRERIFFYAIRNDLLKYISTCDLFGELPSLDLDFNEKEIVFGKIYDGLGKPITDYLINAWNCRKPTDSGVADSKKWANMKVSDFNNSYLFKYNIMPTITAKGNHTMTLYDKPVYVSDTELIKGGSFPIDYDFLGSKPGYIVGMSVPPLMTYGIATRIYEQWKILNYMLIF